jgi:curved DNA-binding protein
LNFKDYYKTLNVSRTASQDEIKKSYRKLARQYHPDVNPGNKEAEEKFKEISEAYEVLSHPENRKKYDQLGADWKKYEQAGQQGGFDWSKYAGQQRQGGQQQYAGGDYEDMFSGGGGFSDFFENIFGGGFGGARTQQGRQRQYSFKGQDYRAEMEMSLEEAYLGTSRILNVNGQQLRIKVKPGIADGQTLRLSGKGAPGSNGGENGDLYIKVHIAEDKRFRRSGDDIYKDQPVDLYTAVLGGEVQVSTLDGDLKFKIPAETQNGATLRLKGKGFPKYNQTDSHGDLYLKIEVELPKKLSEEEKTLFRRLAEIRKS